jgi:hypothetical protein
MRVQDCHTFFIGSSDWGFSLWVHNPDEDCSKITAKVVADQVGKYRAARNRSGPSKSSLTPDRTLTQELVPPKYTTPSTNPEFVEGAAQKAEQAVINRKLAGSLEKAQQAAKEGNEIAPGLFKYHETKTIKGYAQHHLWPQAMGGPKQGWTVYARQQHQTIEGIQGRLNTFLRDKTGESAARAGSLGTRKP